MNDKWRLNVWGVRGSFPTPAAEYLEYGGNTSCISVACENELVVFDAGSGLAVLGSSLSGQKRIHLFLSHFHLDHVMGLFLFQPFHDPDAEIHLYGEATEGIPFQTRLRALVGRPYWPLELNDFPARIQIHEICSGACFPLGQTSIQVKTMHGNHPGGSLLYRLEDHSRSIVHALDCELEDELAPALTAFAQNASLLIWDANFTSNDLIKGWGHSTWEQGLALGRTAGVRTVLMTHFSRTHTDSFLREQERLAQAQAACCCCFARERMEITI